MHRLRPLLSLVLAALALQAQAQSLPPGGTPPSGGAPGGSAPGASTPTLMGDSVTITQYYPDVVTAGVASTVTVSSAVEVSCPDTTLALCGSTSGSAEGLLDGEYIDIGTTTISGQFLAPFSAAEGATFNGLSFTGLNFGASFSGISGFTLTTNIDGLSMDRITYTADSLQINLLGLDPSNTTDGSGIGTFSISLNVSAVPEPASAMMILAGLLALGQVRRRRS